MGQRFWRWFSGGKPVEDLWFFDLLDCCSSKWLVEALREEKEELFLLYDAETARKMWREFRIFELLGVAFFSIPVGVAGAFAFWHAVDWFLGRL